MADPKDIKKSVEETVNQILSSEANGGSVQQIQDPTAPADAAAKAMPTSTPANGGKDAIRSGSPMTEEEKAEEAKKAKAAEDEKKKKEEDEAKKAMAAKDADKKKDKDGDYDKDGAACKSKDKMKKSIEELAEHLDDEELELVKSWREECAKEAMAKSQAASEAPAAPTMAQIEEVLKKAVAESTADLKKAMDEKDTLIKGLNDKIEKMASQPAYDRRSISTLETLEKSGGSDSGELTKSQVLDKMLELQAAGKGVTSHHVAEFEATRNISDPMVRGIVFRELKVNQ